MVTPTNVLLPLIELQPPSPPRHRNSDIKVSTSVPIASIAIQTSDAPEPEPEACPIIPPTALSDLQAQLHETQANPPNLNTTMTTTLAALLRWFPTSLQPLLRRTKSRRRRQRRGRVEGRDKPATRREDSRYRGGGWGHEKAAETGRVR